MRRLFTVVVFCWVAYALVGQSLSDTVFRADDVFHLEYISNPRINADGSEVVYVRNSMDIFTDGLTSQIWMADIKSGEQRLLTSDGSRNASPVWSPDYKSIAFVSNRDQGSQIFVMNLADRSTRRLTNLTDAPGNLSWSPDGQYIVFNMSVDNSPQRKVKLPQPPKHAKWSEPPVYIDKIKYKSDGAGFLKNRSRQVFVISSEGGYARQLTFGDKSHSGPFSWSSDGRFVYFSSNLTDEEDSEPRNSEIYTLDIQTGLVKAVTDRLGPDFNPVISPSGKYMAYLGNDETYKGYQQTELYIMTLSSGEVSCLTTEFDRDVNQVFWQDDEKGLWFRYDTEGQTKIASIDLKGKVTDRVRDLGGMSLGRPYASGDYSVSRNGTIVFTLGKSDRPAELAVYNPIDKKVKTMTQVNEDLLGHKTLATVEEIWFESSYDGQQVQGWICKPPGFDPEKKYPLILEIHGGPFLNYGDRFSAEYQLFASAGYVVLFINPRGSTSYGEAFANYIHHNYPSEDYDDLISGVDAVIAKGYIDEDNLFVTGGSGGGVLTAWIVGKTNRFAAAVVAKPVINWTSFVLHADGPEFFAKYWFGTMPWEDVDSYWKRSPLSLVGNVTTPTMLLTGEQDYRTPMSETEQYYAALKLAGVETAMVRVQNAGHGIANKPSNLVYKVAYILDWFERHRNE